MELNDLLNIRNINIEDTIKEVISSCKLELNGLTTNQTCKIWSSYIYEELRKRHVLVELLSTEDIEDAYIHYFNAIPYNCNYYVIDLTFKQFNSNELNYLSNNGYQLLNKEEQNKYLNIVAQKKNLDSSFDDLLFKNSNKTIN